MTIVREGMTKNTTRCYEMANLHGESNLHFGCGRTIAKPKLRVGLMHVPVMGMVAR